MEAKRDLRRRLRRQRRRIPASYRRRAERRLRAETLRAVRRLRAQRVASYLDADGEAPTGALMTALRADGVALYLPVLQPGQRRMAFRRYDAGTPLRPNRYGVPEPVPGASPMAPARALDVVLAPLVAFDAAGRRLGMGGGHYDATLAFLRRYPWHPPRVLGVAFASQQVPALPSEDWDLPLAGVITERGYVSLPARQSAQEGP